MKNFTLQMRILRVALLVFVAAVSANTLTDKFNSMVSDAKKRFKTTSDSVYSSYKCGMEAAVKYYGDRKSEVMRKFADLSNKYAKQTEEEVQKPVEDDVSGRDPSTEFDADQFMKMLKDMLEKQDDNNLNGSAKKEEDKECESEKKEL